MYSRVKKVFIGKDVDWAGATSIYADATGTVAAAGEVLVLDKNLAVMAAGTVYGDTDKIYIAEALSETYSLVNEAGTSVTGIRRFILSDAIDGALVKTYAAKPYVGTSQKVVTLDVTAAATFAVGTEYIVRIVYKDIKEHPAQFTHTYRVIGIADLDTTWTAMASAINADSKTRVTASYAAGTDVLTLTGKAIATSTTSLTDIDEFSMVDFEVFCYYVSVATGTKGQHIALEETQVVTLGNAGTGNWYQVRDAEKSAWGQQFGVFNRIYFPVKTPAVRTVLDETYNVLVIESDKSYLSPDNGYVKTSPVATIAYLATGAAQTAKILAVLNPWMASIPSPKANAVII
jgi:hypothetical protein